jgi:hypothetical protein
MSKAYLNGIAPKLTGETHNTEYVKFPCELIATYGTQTLVRFSRNSWGKVTWNRFGVDRAAIVTPGFEGMALVPSGLVVTR